MTASRLTGVLREIADVAGEPAAISFAAMVGGTRVYIPAKISDKHWLVECVGRRAADAMCEHFKVDGKRGAHIDVPLGGGGAYKQLRRAITVRVHKNDLEKKSARVTAQQCGITQRTIHAHRRRRRRDPEDPQGSLL